MALSFILALALLPVSFATAQQAPRAEKEAPKPSYPLLEQTFKAGLTPDQQRGLGEHATLDQLAKALTPRQKEDIRRRLDDARAQAATPEALKEIAHGYLLLDEHGPQAGKNVVAIGAKLRELEPKKPDGYAIEAEGYYRLGDYPAAAVQARQAWELSGRADQNALSILKASEGRSAAVPAAAATASAPDGVTVAGADFTIPEKNDISPKAMAFVRQAVAARREGDMARTWTSIQAAMNADPASTAVQTLYSFAKEDRAKYTETLDSLRRSKEALAAGRGKEAVDWAQKAADRSGDPGVRGILELTKRRSAKLAQAPAKSEAPAGGTPLWPIGAGLGLAAAGYGLYRSKQTYASVDGLDPSPPVAPDQEHRNYLKTAAVAGTAFIALAAWEFGPGALSAARTLFAALGSSPAVQLAAAGAGASGGAIAADQALVANGALVAGAATTIVGAGAISVDHVNYSKSPAQSGSPDDKNEPWRSVKPSRPLNKMGHAQKHLPDFQKLDPALQAEDVARILEYARLTGESAPTANGGRLITAMVEIGGRGVVIKVVETAAGLIKTGFPEVPR